MNSDFDNKLAYCSLLGNPYAKLSVLNDEELSSLGEVTEDVSNPVKARVNFAKTAARKILIEAWKISGHDVENVLAFLKQAPRVIATEILKLRVLEQPEFEWLRLRESLRFEIAGFMDRGTKTIGIVNTHSRECQRFTLAHELGHWLLHPEEVKFRDSPITALDAVSLTHDPAEREANAFAAELLMPQKTVKAEFMNTFGRPLSLSCDSRIIAELATLSRISSPDPTRVEKLDMNAMACIIAQIAVVNGRHVESLCERFDVSSLAMGIRLKELELIVA